MKTRRIILTLLLCILTTMSYAQTLPSQAGNTTPQPSDVPRIISYQGLVRGTTGQPISDSKHNFIITLYSDEAGTLPVWSDSYDLTTDHGIFNVLLGGGQQALPAGDQLNRALWVGVRLDGQDEMRPLSQLVSSPFALNVANNSITTNKLQDSAVTAEKMGTNYVANGGTGASTLTDHRVLIGEGISAIGASASMTSGQLLIGQGSSSDPTPQTISGDISLTNAGLTTVTGIQGIAVSSSAPSTNYVLAYVGGQWTPTAVTGTNGGTVTGVTATLPATATGSATVPNIALNYDATMTVTSGTDLGIDLDNANTWTNTISIHPTTDITSLVVMQTSHSTPSNDILDIQNSAGRMNYLAVNKNGKVIVHEDLQIGNGSASPDGRAHIIGGGAQCTVVMNPLSNGSTPFGNADDVAGLVGFFSNATAQGFAGGQLDIYCKRQYTGNPPIIVVTGYDDKSCLCVPYATYTNSGSDGIITINLAVQPAPAATNVPFRFYYHVIDVE